MGWFRDTVPIAELARRMRHSPFFLNLFSVAGATFLSRLIGVVALGYPARTLGPENYGTVGFGFSVFAYAGILLSPGLLVWGTREIARCRERAGETTIIVLLARLFLACVGYACVAVYATFFTDSAFERNTVLICCLSLFGTALAVDWVFNGLELMRIPAFVGVLGSGLYVGTLFVFVRSHHDAYVYAALGPALSLFPLLAMGALLLRQPIRWNLPTAGAFFRALWSSLPLGAMVALVIILHYANNFIVKAYLGAAVLGVFLSAYRLIELATTVPGILASVFLARLARFVATAPDEAIREARVFAQAHMILGFFVAAVFFAEARDIVRILYGTGYEDAAGLLRIMAVSVIFNYAICGYTNCLISFGKDRVMLMVVAVSAVVSLAGGFLLVPRIGAPGAALAIMALDLAGWLVSLPAYKRAVGSLLLDVWVRPALGGLCVIAVCAALRHLGVIVWIRGPIEACIYTPFVLLEIRRAFRDRPARHIGDNSHA